MENKQTAVEWLEDSFRINFNKIFVDTDFGLISHLINEAKGMETKQIREAYYKGVRDEWESAGRDFQDYYNEKYANDTTTGLPKENSKRRGWHY